MRFTMPMFMLRCHPVSHANWRLPFPIEPRSTFASRVWHDPYEPIRDQQPDVPLLLEKVCDKCLRKNPSERGTAHDLVTALTDWLNEDALNEKPTDLFVSNWGDAKRPPKPLVSVGQF